MPVYDQGYRRYEARGPLRRVRFWPITREALRLILSKRAFLGLLILSWVPFLFRVGQIVLVTYFPDAARVLPLDGRLFGEFLNQQVGPALLLSIFGGAGLIANDLRTGGILVYLSRPLTRRDYVVGKLGVLLGLNLSATLVPGLLLYAIALAMVPKQFAVWSLAWLGPAVVAHSLVLAGVLSLLSLAASALSRSARVAGLGLVGLWVGLEIVRQIVRAITRRPEAILLSLQADLRALGNALFGVPARGDAGLHWIWPALVLAGVAALCLLILRARVRAVEIVT
jgi:ABC-2 type transport system permease protein